MHSGYWTIFTSYLIVGSVSKTGNSADISVANMGSPKATRRLSGNLKGAMARGIEKARCNN